MADFQLQGMESLLAKFESLKHDVKYKGGRAALRKSANFIADKVRQAALQLDDPATAEVIAKNVSVRWNGRRYKSTGDLGFRVGIMGGARPSNSKEALRAAARRRKRGISSLAELGEFSGKGKANPGGDTFYFRFLEFGTENAAARPFMRPALANNSQQAIDVFAKAFEKSIASAIKKANETGK